MAKINARSVEMPLGVVIRKAPGATRWAAWSWRAVAILPGAGPAEWAELRREGDVVEYHAATLPLTLWADETEAYLVNLNDRIPSVYLVLREEGDDDRPLVPVLVTASPYEGQDYADTGEEIVEKIPMTPGLIAWVRDFAQAYHQEEVFVKRSRSDKRGEPRQGGIGDPRVQSDADVYRAPDPRRRRAVQ
ncbi:DUF3305 domain-containing protein [Jhaorihella thermophila]|uniref:Molybdopterin-guanine dinucleotide biosynthesis protein A n=1 Tax=Jhaorihella thermophila TaxID=488547 RepID=A0A1H5WMA6_9RHOB|nr:DUF3305 domain-containing protein [Jhaorihella thermophila]SEG00604.1 Protein of unknown function [Jhaorihella thermophila]